VQVQEVERVEVFRTRMDKDGSLQVWAPGWRLELRFAALVPPLLAIGFLLSNLPLPVRLLFAVVLIGCGLVVQRMTSTGIVLTADEVRLVGMGRTRTAKWDDVAGFVGERDAHEGRPVLLIADGERLKAPGSLPSETMDTFWNETEVSAIDQLNGIVEAFRSGELAPATDAPEKRPRPAREKKQRPPRVKADRPPLMKRVRRTGRKVEKIERIDIQTPTAEPAEAADPAPIVDPERSMAHAGATRAPRTSSRGVEPEYVVTAAAQRSSYPSRGAERLAEWERAHATATEAEKESKPRRSRRRSRS